MHEEEQTMPVVNAAGLDKALQELDAALDTVSVGTGGFADTGSGAKSARKSPPGLCSG
jgi:hypothetical protein